MVAPIFPIDAGRRQFLAGCLGVALALRGGLSRADPGSLTVWPAADTPLYGAVLDALTDTLPDWRIETVAPGAFPTPGVTKPLLTLGPQAARAVLNLEHTGPLLTAMLSAAQARALAKKLTPSQQLRWAALVLDQPLARQLGLLGRLLPQARRIGVLLAPDAEVAPLQAHARAAGYTLRVTRIGDGEAALFKTLKTGLGDIDALWLLPDPAHLHRGNLPAVLLAAYRARVPVLAYSQALVNAGALAAVHGDSRDIALDCANWLRQSRPPLGLVEPRHFSVAVNAGVARSLGLPPLDEKMLQQQLAREYPS